MAGLVSDERRRWQWIERRLLRSRRSRRQYHAIPRKLIAWREWAGASSEAGRVKVLKDAIVLPKDSRGGEVPSA